LLEKKKHLNKAISEEMVKNKEKGRKEEEMTRDEKKKQLTESKSKLAGDMKRFRNQTTMTYVL